MRLLLDNTVPDELAPVTGIEQPFESELYLLASQSAPLLRLSHRDKSTQLAHACGL